MRRILYALALLAAAVLHAPSAEAATQGMVPQVNYGTGLQVLKAGDCIKLPGAVSPWVCGGGSAPSSVGCTTAAPVGSLCLDFANALLYSNFDNASSVTRVQEQSVYNTYSLTLSAAPAPGNVLWAFCGSTTAAPSANTGWTPLTGGLHSPAHGNDPYVLAVYHAVLPTDTATVVPCTGSGPGGVVIKETNGTDPLNPQNSVDTLQFNSGGSTSGTYSLTLTTTTATVNELGLSGGFHTISSIATLPAPTFNAGWGNVAQQDNCCASWSMSIADQFYSGGGSAVTSIVSTSDAGLTSRSLSSFLLMLRTPADPLTSGYQQVSYLTKVFNGGTLIAGGVSLAPGPRSIAFPSGCASADPDFNITISCAGTLTPTGSPVSGELAKWSGSLTLTNGDLSGDVSTSGSLVTTIGANKVTMGDIAQITDGTELSNITGSTGNVSANGPSAIWDHVFCSAQGSILYRDASAWKCLAPATAGWSLTTNGAGANPSWANVGGGGGGGVTQVNTNAPWTSGGPITSTGTVDVGKVVKAAVSGDIMSGFGGL